MARIDPNSKSVRFPKEVDERLSLLARKLGRTKREVVMQMVDYFYKSKKDPSDLNDEVLKKELSSGISRILSFIRKQENDLLVPIYNIVDELLPTTKHYGAFTKKVGESQLRSEKSHGDTQMYVQQMGAVLKKVLGDIPDRQRLKTDCRRILEHYIEQRENLGWPTSAAKKDELARQVRQALDKL
ncbi:BfmA/BtgA family mobilization protein [Sphingobacterium hotanense]|uniref:BfmA/BtgA family mobilization protein n=1 Tax=Sphingobacterium hotanense TaxID=649196 RepID=UPI0021A3C203|nr:BfmA/BtgA family mobilization protein [Sphingobacterium hotanense]MCT1525048.1 hypothetical protein [Sphingobacterium hotanense]